MFKIIQLDGKTKIPDDDICYILAKGGTFLKKKVGLIESLTPVKEISILEEVEPYAKLNVPKIPGKTFAKIMMFFKKAYETYKSEAVVLLYYNAKKSAYKIHVPHQKVSGAGVEYTKGISLKDYVQVGTIHSHADFSAFHSGTDDSDEEHFDGLHITIGNNMDEFPSWSTSIVVNGMRFKVCPTEYVEDLEIVEYTKFFPQMFRPAFIEINGVKEYKTNVKSTLAYRLNVTLEDNEFNEKWMERIEDTRPVIVETKTSTWMDFLSSGNSYGYTYGKNNIRENNIYLNARKYAKEKPKYDPCSSCVFKNHKSKEVEETPEKKTYPQTSFDLEDFGV